MHYENEPPSWYGWLLFVGFVIIAGLTAAAVVNRFGEPRRMPDAEPQRAAHPPREIPFEAVFLDDFVLAKDLAELHRLHDHERVGRGLPALRQASQLSRAAQAHADWMAKQQLMTHSGPSRSSPAQRLQDAGYQYSAAGENIAAGYPTAEAVFAGWLKSRGHKANILGEQYSEVGFGLAHDKQRRAYWCAVFARPAAGVEERWANEISAPPAIEGD